MNDHVSWLVKAYNRLLTDVHEATGLPIGTPGTTDCTYQWLLVEAPRLDKLVMQCLEATPPDKGDTKLTDGVPDLGPDALRLREEVLASTPDWILPLVERVVTPVNPEPLFVRYLHQTLVFGYKVEHEASTKQIAGAQASFEETDDLCDVWWSHANHSMGVTSRYWSLARSLVSQVIGNIQWSDLRPTHGPGAVFQAVRPSAKTKSFIIDDSIQKHYPFDEYFVSQPEGLLARIGELTEAPVSSGIQLCRMVAVPKDSRGPRLICVHSAEAIWVQQGQRRLLEAAIQRHPLTRGRINFRDQKVNGALALRSSADREYMTIDLKEASDRISKHLVHYLFGDYAYAKVSCSRATHVELLDKRVRELGKWAPMGNALCFPVESLIFWALACAGICKRHRLTNVDDVYVFGDDIIVPSKYYEGCMEGLARAGLVPNMAKTFRRGFFRESCGVDAYRGEDVTPLRVKTCDTASVLGAVATCDLAKRAKLRGLLHLSGFLYSSVRRWWYVPLCTNPFASGIYEYVGSYREVLLYEAKLRYNRDQQHYRIPVVQVEPAMEHGLTHDWNHVLDSLIQLEQSSSNAAKLDQIIFGGGLASGDGLQYAIPRRERSKRGWATLE